MRARNLFVFAAALGSLVACGGGDDADAGGAESSRERPLVVTTFYPTQYFAERIGGARVEVRCDVPADADALFWEPSRELVAEYQDADLVVLNGAGLERWLDRVSLPPSKVVDTSKSFESSLVRFEDATTHRHGGGDEHTHEGVDPHTWLDPVNAKAQARAIHAAIAGLLPDHAEELQANFDALASDLDSLHDGFTALGKGKHVLASHPAYNYLAQRYGWDVSNLDLDPETYPTRELLQTVYTALEKGPAEHILWESKPTEPIEARFLDEFEITSVVVSPCELLDAESRAAGADYLSVMRANLERLGPVFE